MPASMQMSSIEADQNRCALMPRPLVAPSLGVADEPPESPAPGAQRGDSKAKVIRGKEEEEYGDPGIRVPEDGASRYYWD